MILDHLSHAKLYFGLGPRFAKAFQFLSSTDLLNLTLGKHEIEGEKIFALVQEYIPKPRAVGKFEAHERYWDIQYVAQGQERMGWSPRPALTVTEPHDAKRDIAFFASDPALGLGEFFLLEAGFFTVFSPHDAHMPGVAPESRTAELVRKVVIKVDLHSS
jgi:biofilm protein TabA